MGLLHEESRILTFVRPPAERLSQHLILRANNKECTTAWRFNRQLFLSAVWSHLSPSQWLVIDSRNNDIGLSIRCHLYHQSSHLIGLISELESVKLYALCYLSWLGPNFGVVCEFTFFNYKPYPIFCCQKIIASPSVISIPMLGLSKSHPNNPNTRYIWGW